MSSKSFTLFNRVKEIYRAEGPLITIKRICTFAASVVSSTISYENSVFYVYVKDLTKRDKVNYIPKILNVNHRIVETPEQLDELSNQGYELSLVNIDQARYRLYKGAVLSLLFIGNELGSTSWAALTEEAKNTFNWYPYKVNFEDNEVCGGATWVNPKYRGQGLIYYTLYEKEKYLVEKGATKNRSIVLTSNIATQRANANRGSELVAKARYIRVFGLQFWREKPVKPVNNKDS